MSSASTSPASRPIIATMRRTGLVLVLVLGLSVLTGACVKDRPSSGSTSAAASGSGNPSAPDGKAVPPASSGPTGAPSVAVAAPAPNVNVTVLAPGHFAIEATRETSLTTNARLERKNGAGWQALENLDLGTGYRLVEACPPRDTVAPRCVTIAPGKTLRPVPWQGLGCSAQCNATCRANAWEGPGTFRLVVSPCDGGAAVEGPTFELPDATFAGREAFARWGLAAGLTRVAIVRLVLEGAARDDVPRPADGRIFGYTTVPASERRLVGTDVEALAALLRAPKGFDDRIQKRCAMKTLVGFRLERSLASTSLGAHTETTEMAIDFTCAKLFAVRGEGAARTVTATHFDPSRPAFLELVKRALPDDPELTKLR